jgi:hypothetical protein
MSEDLIQQREELRGARATGVRAITFADGRKVEYRSDQEMAAAIADLDRRIAMGGRTSPTTIVFATSKGC